MMRVRMGGRVRGGGSWCDEESDGDGVYESDSERGRELG